MKLIENILTEIFGEVIKKSFNSETVKNFYIQETSNPNFGDFQTNFAMINAKELKMPPRKIAEKILENFPENSDVIEKTEIAGPGFINIFLKQEFLNNYLKKLLREKPDYSLTGPNDIVIDYSSPNIAKPMHIGHFRTTVIGDSIKRIFRYMGYNVIGDNHLGDWGTQFGKLIVAYRLWLDRENYEKNPINELEKLYVKFTLESEKDESLEEQARKELKKLQDGDAENTRLWKEFIEMSMKEYNKIYERLEISFDTYYGESFYHNIMPEIIKSLKEKNIAQQDQGALVVKFDEKEDLHPCIVQKSDGAFLYATSDLACIKFRREHYNLNRLIYVTDFRQQSHFRQVFKIAEMLGWNEKKDHVYYGLMRFEDGVFSTRKGNVIKLEDLIETAVSKAKETLLERAGENIPEDIDNRAEIIGVGALKYGDLSQNRTSDIIFDWDKMLSFNSNSSLYLQYTYARIKSLLKKGNFEKNTETYSPENSYEEILIRHMVKFPSAVLRAADAYKPNIISDYLYELAQKFNSFYNNVPVLKAEKDLLESRLNLIEKVSLIIKEGLDLLGIKTLEEM